MLAISIPYTGALAKVFGELLENEIENQRASLRVFGASSFQCLIYDYLPSIAQDLFSYTLYRLECAVRSSAALSFVGLGGIGFLIQLSLQDLNFNSMWTYLYFLIALVALVDYGSGIILKRLSVNDGRGVYAIFAAWIFAWGYILRTQLGDMTQIFSARNMQYLRNFVGNIFNWKAIGTLLSTPEFVQTLWTLCKETFLMSVYAITLTVLLLIPFVLFGSKIFVRLASSEAEKIVARTLRAITNIFFVITRSVPEVLWGMIFVFIFKPGWFPGVIALALHNFGVLGRLCNDVMDAIDKRKLLALRNNGASKTQLVIYGILPMIKNNVIIYTFYRWEIIIRTTIVVGFIGAGGLGQALRLAISFFRFEEIGIYIFAYTVMVIMTELLSMMVKRAYAERRLLYVD